MFRLAVLAGLVAYTAALSSQCYSTILNLTGNAAASQCLAIGSFIQVTTVGANTSIVQPLNNWLGDMCSASACSNATLASIATNLTAGCSADFPSNATSLTSQIQEFYPTVRKILCLKHGSTLCVTETLTNLETVTGPLTLPNVVKLFESPPTSVPSSIICTDCNKASYNIWVKDVPSSVSSSKPVLESQCGASFVDGSDPSSVSQSANTGVASLASATTSHAFSLLGVLTNSVFVAIGASGFVALSTVYTILI